MKIVKKERPIAYILFSAIIVFVVALDQFTKWLAVKFLEPINDVPIIKNIFHLTYTTNDGAAGGILDDNRWVFMTVSTVAIIGMFLYVYLGHSGSLLVGSAMSMIISGGIGNMIDRTFRGESIFNGEVVDFLNTCFVLYPTSIKTVFKFSEWQTFPIFNVADCFVCIGAATLAVALVVDTVKEMRQKRENGENSEKGEEE